MDSDTAISLMLVVGIIIGGPGIAVFGLLYLAEFVEAWKSWSETYKQWKAKR